MKVGNRLITAISEPMPLQDHPSRRGASIGIAIYPQHGATPTDLQKAADQSMYRAKRGGKGCVVVAGRIG